MSVTAVPLHPLDKGSVPKLWIGLLLVLLLAAGLAFVGTSRLQIMQGENGMTYRVYEAGSGDPVAKGDVAQVHVEVRTPSGEVIQSTRRAGQPVPLTFDTVDNGAPWLKSLFLQMRKDSAYQVFVPARSLTNGQPLPPEGPLKDGDVAEFRVEVVNIQRGGVAQQMEQQMQEQMMRQMQEQGGPGGVPGGPPGGPSAPPPSPGG